MTRLETFKAIVRPFCIIYSMVVLSILVIMQMCGYPIPTAGVGETIVYTFLAITGLITTEYAAERGARNLLDRRNARYIEQLKMMFLETEATTDENS